MPTTLTMCYAIIFIIFCPFWNQRKYESFVLKDEMKIDNNK